MRLVFLLCIPCLFLSCTNLSKKADSEIDGKLTAEKIYIGQDLAPDFLLLKSNHLFIASSKKDMMIDVFSTPDLHHVISTAPKGEGPGEMIFFPMFCRSFDNKIYIWGYNHILVRSFFMKEDKLDLVEEWNIPRYEAFNQMYVIEDSLLVYFVPEDGMLIKKINYRSGEVVAELTIPRDDANGTYFDLSKGNISLNKNRLIYSYCHKNQIDMYSLEDFSLIKRTKGRGQKHRVIFGDFENLMQYYTAIYAGEKYIYAIYHGDFFASNSSSTLIIYNYDLESVTSFRLDSKLILAEIDECNGIVYGYDPALEDYMLKYSFDFN